MTKRIDITDYGAVNGGEVLCTTAIQFAIDKAAEMECEVYVPKGIYLTGALFLKSNMSLHLAKGAVLLGIADETAYPIRRSCVAGVEMDWHTGIINIFEVSHVRVLGAGIIDGQGVIHNVIVQGCSDVQLEDFGSVRSGFRSIYICYSENVVVRGGTVSDNDGSSADGITINSCSGVLVEKCRISCNDDNICIKAGCDAGDLRVNRICENIMVRDCEILEGTGVTLGSDSSGGMRNISICDNVFKGTICGFRMKSAKNRGGLIEDVEVTNLKMENVCCCFSFAFSRNPAYGYCETPADYRGEISKRRHVLSEKLSENFGIPCVRNIRISKVTSFTSKECQGNTKAFDIEGLAEAPFEDFVFEDMQIQAKEYGTIANVKNFRFVDVAVDIVQ